METTIIGTKKGLNILKMSRKVLKNWGRPLSNIFQFEAAPNSGKIVEAAPFSHPPPPSHY
jgi:hypothetical protein